eukprot:1345014-Rhodomonas_salina.1
MGHTGSTLPWSKEGSSSCPCATTASRWMAAPSRSENSDRHPGERQRVRQTEGGGQVVVLKPDVYTPLKAQVERMGARARGAQAQLQRLPARARAAQ